MDCPGCGEWIDADAEECKCGWAIEGFTYAQSMYYEEDENVQEPEP